MSRFDISVLMGRLEKALSGSGITYGEARTFAEAEQVAHEAGERTHDKLARHLHPMAAKLSDKLRESLMVSILEAPELQEWNRRGGSKAEVFAMAATAMRSASESLAAYAEQSMGPVSAVVDKVATAWVRSERSRRVSSPLDEIFERLGKGHRPTLKPGEASVSPGVEAAVDELLGSIFGPEYGKAVAKGRPEPEQAFRVRTREPKAGSPGSWYAAYESNGHAAEPFAWVRVDVRPDRDTAAPAYAREAFNKAIASGDIDDITTEPYRVGPWTVGAGDSGGNDPASGTHAAAASVTELTPPSEGKAKPGDDSRERDTDPDGAGGDATGPGWTGGQYVGMPGQ